jgi:hypothetical protein
MEKFIVIGNDEPEQTQYEYALGEIITVNSIDKYKCINKKIMNGNLYQFFKKGKLSFDW